MSVACIISICLSCVTFLLWIMLPIINAISKSKTEKRIRKYEVEGYPMAVLEVGLEYPLKDNSQNSKNNCNGNTDKFTDIGS